MAGVALCDIHLRFMWQAWHVATSTFTLNDRYGIYGSRGTYGIGLAPVARFGRDGRRGCCCGRYGTLRYPPWFYTTDVVFGDIDLYFVGEV